jgi:hypothetical protein
MEEAVAFCKRQSVSNERGKKKKKDTEARKEPARRKLGYEGVGRRD